MFGYASGKGNRPVLLSCRLATQLHQRAVPLAAVENALVLDGSSYACMQVHGMSIRQAAREFGLPRKRPVQRPKLGPWLGIIDRILVDDQSQPKKQRHTVERIRA